MAKEKDYRKQGLEFAEGFWRIKNLHNWYSCVN